ncbi:hypothetical protein KQI89_11845 [Clostridium sp. MSJ-4]|uniref:Uncharacterized protein n=1 Tax=Clostridium simiarum TaxID=2841506 RepID=A0ABS6F3K4_9CLOT|nr:hypothetical protein [Clostridium simiarum]MBU5592449.1 hypothetical protein [Clostridium simiarum]
MKKSLVRGIVSGLALCITMISFSDVNVKADVVNERLSYNESVKLQNGAEVTTLYSDDDMVTYLVKEDGYKYTVKFDVLNYLVTLNNKTYTLNDYQSAAIKEIEMKNSNARSLNKPNIVEILDNYETVNKFTLENGVSSNIMSYSDLPTTGYGVERKVATMKEVNFTLGLTTALLTAAAAFFLKGNIAVTKVFVSKVIKEAIAAGIIAVGAEYISGGDAYYDKYQAHHSTLPATKERRVPFYKKYSFTSYGDSWTHYFWYAQPSY